MSLLLRLSSSTYPVLSSKTAECEQTDEACHPEKKEEDREHLAEGVPL
eukprot:CAMPEP_0115229800 /NCGR_PEP_ID=MMETSP0270-20121206/32388_1 /TAXON_ID=71861 /ORGANISM="Scrippsiella trochoidea, Strain CCMP3099" /LENGTH=47 /DNA_ID= /DNA_START= /DNA_END= /DNA_ORIENTATION=